MTFKKSTITSKESQHSFHQKVKSSGGWPTPAGKEGRLRPCRRQPKRLNSLPAGKRPPAAERNIPS
ncbi:hypothetical protein [Rossellomorea marisflavi]|uniref:hypothetical protein n=1 Tax=Rossellomorea marisflavi TaxID=189381 RepID=UPI0015C4A75E|nr:hypothetical protein [Rossellomorea marisflavi]